MISCIAPYCDRLAFSKSLCKLHYQRVAKYKSYDLPKKPTVKDRFLMKLTKTDGCWKWIGAQHKNGRGVFWNGTRQILAYRASWEIFNGKIPEGMLVCHRCDNPNCVNPKHLFIGTQKDNIRDMVKKNRQVLNPKRGSKHHKAKLNERKVTEIRLRLNFGETQASIANVFGVNFRTINLIAKNKIWRHV